MTYFTLEVDGYQPYVGSMDIDTTLPTFYYRTVWDDENIDYNYRSRTLHSEFTGPDNPPAVIKFFPEMNEAIADYRINLEKDISWEWKNTCIKINNYDGNGLQRFEYWSDDGVAQFNTTGWAKMAYLDMSGNVIKVLNIIGEWIKFETLKPTDWFRARAMNIDTHPEYIHKFTCVTWNNTTRTTKRIESSGTPRGQVYYPLVTWLGYAYIPKRHVIRVMQ
jgi:hypothetical protein